MEFKKKTIIWEDNSEPPKDYIWIKPDGKAYEFNYTDRTWKESKSVSTGSGGSGGSDGGGDSTPTEVYIKFKAENFGIRDNDHVPDTVDRNKGYTLDEIFDMSGGLLEGFIKSQEDVRDGLISSEYSLEYVAQEMGYYYYYNGNPGDNPSFQSFNYISYESGEIGSMDGSYPTISLGFFKNDEEYTAKTFIAVVGTNLKSYSWTPPMIVFEKNDEDGKWYIVYAR